MKLAISLSLATSALALFSTACAGQDRAAESPAPARSEPMMQPGAGEPVVLPEPAESGEANAGQVTPQGAAPSAGPGAGAPGGSTGGGSR